MNRSWSLLERLAIATAGLCLILLAVRTASAVSFAIPLHLVTSGIEHGPLYTIWKAVNGLSIASDRHDFPFDSTVYNWLFYRLYGWVIGSILTLFQLDEEWLPTLARLLTASAIPIYILISSRALLVAGAITAPAQKRLAWAMAILLASGPLIGFWSITTRPDYWAALAEIAAVLAFWQLASHRLWAATAAFAALAFLSWSLKQTNVSALCGMGLFLLIRLRWRELLLLGLLSIAGWAATIGFFGAEYANNLFFRGIPFSYRLPHALLVLKGAAIKTAPICAFLAAGLVLLLARSDWKTRICKDERLLFALCCFLVSFLFAFSTSMQDGSAENYYFTTAFFAALSAFCLTRRPEEAPPPRWTGAMHLAGWLGLAAANLLVLAGQAGTLSVRPQHDIFSAQRQCLEGLTPPYYVKDDYLSLPWMAKGNPPIALSYSYYDERRVGNPFQHGGMGGLIEQGFFTTLVFVAQTPPEELDGAKLTGYIPRQGACAGMLFMDRAGGSRP